MIYTNVDINKLILIQGSLVIEVLKKCLKLGEDKTSIPLIPYQERYIVCDGHHRTTTKLILGKEVTPAAILEEDKDISTKLRGLFSCGEYGSLNAVRVIYEDCWGPLTEKQGVRNFQDYLHVYSKNITKMKSELNIK